MINSNARFGIFVMRSYINNHLVTLLLLLYKQCGGGGGMGVLEREKLHEGFRLFGHVEPLCK